MKSTYRKEMISWLLILTGLGWVFYLLATHFRNPQLFIPKSWGWLALATLLTSFSIALNGAIYYLFLQAHEKNIYHLRQALKSFYIAQWLRYLPGRVWGILYQINTSKDYIPVHRLTRANLDFMIFSLIGSSFVAALLIASQNSWPPHYQITILLAGLLLISSTLLGGVYRLVRACKPLLPKRLRRCHKFFNALADEKVSPLQLLKVGFWFSLSWALYVTGWMLLGNAYSQFSDANFVVLCALYSLASIAGILSAITPAGIGVREAIFLLLAIDSQPPEAVAFFALFGRLWLIIIDLILLLAPIGIWVFERSSTNEKASNS